MTFSFRFPHSVVSRSYDSTQLLLQVEQMSVFHPAYSNRTTLQLTCLNWLIYELIILSLRTHVSPSLFAYNVDDSKSKFHPVKGNFIRPYVISCSVLKFLWNANENASIDQVVSLKHRIAKTLQKYQIKSGQPYSLLAAHRHVSILSRNLNIILNLADFVTRRISAISRLITLLLTLSRSTSRLRYVKTCSRCRCRKSR